MSVKPAYRRSDVARLKLPSNIDQPRTGQANIRETVKRFGMVYIFSLSVGFLWSPPIPDKFEAVQVNVRR